MPRGSQNNVARRHGRCALLARCLARPSFYSSDCGVKSKHAADTGQRTMQASLQRSRSRTPSPDSAGARTPIAGARHGSHDGLRPESIQRTWGMLGGSFGLSFAATLCTGTLDVRISEPLNGYAVA